MLKKSKTKMVNLFDRLPMDVIKYEIIPYIANDYFARIGINSLLPPVDRQSTPLRLNAANELGISLSVAKLNRLVAFATNTEEQESKAEYIGETFAYLLTNPLILQHNLAFRNTVLAKAATFADPDCNQYTNVSEVSKANLIDKSCQLLSLNKPYLYHCAPAATTKESKWSSVEGAGNLVVVDNERALILAAKEERAKLMAAEKERRSKPHWNYFSRRRYDYDDDDGDWEYGYYGSDGKWVFLEDDTQSLENDTTQRVSRRGTVMDADGWETVVSKKRW